MLEKRDLQLVRLAVRRKWLTAEEGEDCLFLKRKLGDRYTIEEVIRKRGYLDETALAELAADTERLIRRRPAQVVRAAAGTKATAERKPWTKAGPQLEARAGPEPEAAAEAETQREAPSAPPPAAPSPIASLPPARSVSSLGAQPPLPGTTDATAVCSPTAVVSRMDEGLGVVGDRHKLIRVISDNTAQATVYEAEDINLGRREVVKVLKGAAGDAHYEDGVRRLLREAKALASIRHENVVVVYETLPQVPAIVMELIPGRTLAAHLGEVARLGGASGLLADEVVGILSQVCAGVHQAHKVGVVHRDLKPSNIMLSPREGSFTPRVSVLDFGVARIRSASIQSLTLPGMLVGSLFYMSPEQCAGATADERADVYALGVIAYQCLVGRVPFRGEEMLATMRMHMEVPPPRFPTELPTGSLRLEPVVRKALAKNPTSRFGSMPELEEALRSAATAKTRSFFGWFTD